MSLLNDKIVILDEEGSPKKLGCYVCGQRLQPSSGSSVTIVDGMTAFLHVPLPNKLGDIVGDEFCIVVSALDEICRKCFSLINLVDSLEQQVITIKNQILESLEKTYSIKVSDEESQYKDVNDIACDEPNEEVCNDGETTGDFDSYNAFDEATQANDVSGDSRDFQGRQLCTGMICQFCSLYCDSQEAFKEHFFRNHTNDEIIACIENDSRENLITDEKSCVFDFIGSENVSSFEVIIKDEDITKYVCPNCSLICLTEDGLENHDCSKAKNNGNSSCEKVTVLSVASDDIKDAMEESSKKSSGSSMQDKKDESGNFEPNQKKTLTCNICGVPFDSSSALSRHTQVHKRSEGPVVCHICGKDCHDNLHALYHRRNEHNVSNELTCGICHIPVPSSFELKKHILLNHKGKKEFKCIECGKTFSRSVQFENHRLYSHGNNCCRVCNKHISDPLKLRQHELRHARTDMKKFECNVCQRVFKTSGGLRVHLVSHTGQYKFFCEFCGRGFMSSVILEEHKGVHTKEERYVCDVCGRKFVLYSTFHLHKQWHKNPYPFPCKVCGRKFRYRSERSNHVRRDHTGELPYKCPYCEAAFIKSSYLKKHISGHTKKYPYNCALCERGFDQKRALARHMAKLHEDNSLLESIPKKCQYKVALRPEEYPDIPL